MPKEYRVKDGQNIFDVSVDIYGVSDYAFLLLKKNGLDLSDNLSGKTIYYDQINTSAFKIEKKKEENTNKVYEAKDGQNIFDLALQLYGDIEKTIKIISENNGLESINSDSFPNLDFRYERQSDFLTKYLRVNGLHFNTGKPVLSEVLTGILLTEASDYMQTETGDYILY
jgi:hypothetical protein